MLETVCFWYDPESLEFGNALRTILLAAEIEKIERIIIIVDITSTKLPTFGSHYCLLSSIYEWCLQELTVEDGLRIDLQVFLYPTYVQLKVLAEAYPNYKLFSNKQDIPLRNPQIVVGGNAPRKTIEWTYESFDQFYPSSFETVALGGTFDRLHAGHKLMISSALILTKSKVIVGLTDASMLANKKHSEILLSYEERYATLLRFSRIFSSDIHRPIIEFVRLDDPYGPTITTPRIDLLVVSEETLPGAEQINRIRSERGMSQLVVIPVAFVKLHNGERISSTSIRSILSG